MNDPLVIQTLLALAGCIIAAGASIAIIAAAVRAGVVVFCIALDYTRRMTRRPDQVDA